MKKLYFLFLSISCATILNAQLTQGNHAPVVGDTYQMYQCDSLNINTGASGAGAVWNFSAVATNSNVLKSYTAVAASSATYPNATVAVGSGTSNLSYYNSDATNLKYYGGNITVGAVAVALVYTSAAVQAAYPMALNTATNNTIGGSLTALNFPGTFSGNASVKADGTGTLILPGSNATFSNAIRVVTSQTINFVTVIANGTVTQINYDYFVSGIKAPAFSISSTTLVTSITPASTQVYVYRNKNAVLTATTTVGLKEANVFENQVVMFPNPCNNFINFKLLDNTSALIEIIDLTGKTIDLVEMTSDKATISTSDYNDGLYFYKVKTSQGQNIQSGKFTVTH